MPKLGDQHFSQEMRQGIPRGDMGPYVFLKKVSFRVQTAPFDKIKTEFRRSRRRLLIPDLLKAKKQRREIITF